MKSIRMQNVRSLKDTDYIQLLPINILVGQNSSGKSTFLRLFPLLKQSFNKRTDGPILWAGDVDDYVDFGSFEETLSRSTSDGITLSFEIKAKDIYADTALVSFYAVGRSMEIPDLYNKEDSFFYSVTIKQKAEKTGEYISKVCVNNLKHKVEFLQSETKNQSGVIKIDGEEASFHMRNSNKSSEVTYSAYDQFAGFYRRGRYNSPFGFVPPLAYDNSIEEVISVLEQPFIATLMGSEIDKERNVFEHISYRNGILAGLRFLGALLFFDVPIDVKDGRFSVDSQAHEIFREATEYTSHIIKGVDTLPAGNRKAVNEFAIMLFVNSILEPIEEYIEKYFNQVHYIAPLRATAERYYRLRNLSLLEVDHQGKNLAMFLNGLSTARMNDYQKWTLDHFGFIPLVKTNQGHLSVDIKLRRQGPSVNLSDTGFGYSQILPIVTQLWDLATRKQEGGKQNIPLVIAIEQPELHLHPALQAKLVKAFIETINLAKNNGYDMQLILETHSETIINRFGRAVENKQISPEHIQVLLFDRDFKSKTMKTVVRKSGFDNDGFLQNWPVGFFAPEDK